MSAIATESFPARRQRPLRDVPGPPLLPGAAGRNAGRVSRFSASPAGPLLDARRHDPAAARRAGEGWELTDEQRPAVAAPLEPGLIIAGAGSGKTEVMAARVVHLVASRQVRPDEVLGLTFTTKATASLAARIRAGLERLRLFEEAELGELGADLDGEPVIVDLQRLRCPAGGRARPADRHRADHRGWLRRRCAGSWRWRSCAAGTVRLDVDIQPVNVAERVRRLADEMANHLATPEAVRDATARMEEMVRRRQSRVRTPGRRSPSRRPGCSCSGWSRRSSRPSATRCCSTTAIRSRLPRGSPGSRSSPRPSAPAFGSSCSTSTRTPGSVSGPCCRACSAAGHPVTAVGDPAQSIYGFRGASVGNILRFPEHFRQGSGEPARVYPLTTNFRSGGVHPARRQPGGQRARDGTRRPGRAHPSSRPGPVARAAATAGERSGSGCLPMPKPKRGG